MDDKRTELDEYSMEELEFIEDEELEDFDDEIDEDDIELDIAYDNIDNNHMASDNVDVNYDYSNDELSDISDDESSDISDDESSDISDDESSDISDDDSNENLDNSSTDFNNEHLEDNSSNSSIPNQNNLNNQPNSAPATSGENKNNLNKPQSDNSNSNKKNENQASRNSNSSGANRNNFKGNKNSSSDSKDSKLIQKCLQSGKNKNLAKNNAKNREQDAEVEKQSFKDKVQEKTLEEGLSALAQAYGIPKPIADVAASEVAGPILQKRKERKRKAKKIAGIAIGSVLFILLLVIIAVAGDEISEESSSESRSDYMYGSGSVESLYSYLSEAGLCEEVEDCASTDAAKFYEELKKVLDSNTLLTPQHADSFIIKMISYERDEDDIYTHVDEIQYIADIIGKGVAFDIEKSDNYADEFTQENGYFDTYRSEDLLKNNKTIEYKKELYKKIVKNAKSLVSSLEDSSKKEDNEGPLVCGYNVNGKTPSNIKVRLLQCGDDDRGQPIAGEELVDFEKYILGVVYAENGNGSTESMKAQAIAARTYSLLRGDKMGGAANLGLTYENGQWILSIRNCTEDQVYCDPDKGCWSNDKYAGGTVHSGYDSSKTYKKGALSATSPIRAAVEETAGKVLVGADGSLVYTTYTQTQQDIWNNNAKDGKDHFELLKLTYSSGSRIASTCTGTTSGEYKNWKQCNQSWSSIKLGKSSSNICDAGCYITSIAIQMAASGTKINNKEFNPGVLVNHLSSNYAFSGDGSLTTFAWSNLAPNFKFYNSVNLSGTQSEKAAKIKEYQDAGYYVVIRAKTNQHWVSLDRVEGDQVYMFDPGSSATKLWERYPSNDVTKITIFQKVD